MEKGNYKATIKGINKNQYVVLSTGEVKDYINKSENRTGNIKSLKRTMKNLKYLINNNFVGNRNELFLTLTYKENMMDTERLYDDLKKFIKRLRYKYKEVSTIDYITVVEPQGRGAWHSHTLLRFNDVKTMFVPMDFIQKIWCHGSILDIQHIDKNIDNIGTYFCSYFTDIEIEGYKPSSDPDKSSDIKKVDNKYYLKGGRLHFYPPDINFYRCSRGIKKPIREKMTYKKAKEHIKPEDLTYSGKVVIKTDDFENSITYLNYNSLRNEFKGGK